MRYKVGGQSVVKNLLVTEGPFALWSGAGAGLIGTVPSSAMYFVSYEWLKDVGERNVPSSAHPIVHLTAGGLSELISSVVYVPFEVVKARMMLGQNPHRATNGAISIRTNYRNSLVALSTIAKTEGLRGLYAGYGPCIITDISFRGLQFMLYELGKKKLMERRGGVIQESSFEDLTLGAITGAIAAFLTNPFDVLTARVMIRGMDGAISNRSLDTSVVLSRLIASVKRDGLRVLLDGAFYRCAALAPHSAVTFAVFEWSLRFLDPEKRALNSSSTNDS